VSVYELFERPLVYSILHHFKPVQTLHHVTHLCCVENIQQWAQDLFLWYTILDLGAAQSSIFGSAGSPAHHTEASYTSPNDKQ